MRGAFHPPTSPALNHFHFFFVLAPIDFSFFESFFAQLYVSPHYSVSRSKVKSNHEMEAIFPGLNSLPSLGFSAG